MADVDLTPAAPASAPAVAPHATLTLDPALPRRQALAATFQGVLAYAASMVDVAATEPARAVHEARKSIRRARAAVRLVAPLMRKKRARHLDGVLRDAALETSFARDAEVLAETVKALPAESGAAAAELERVIAAERAGATHPELTREMLARIALRLATLPPHLSLALPDPLDDAALEVALADSFGRARDCLRRAIVTREDEAVHDWRKRTKELRYQLEMLERPGPDGTQPREKALGRIAKELGVVTDLMVLRETVKRHGAALGPLHCQALVDALDGMIPARFEAVARAGQPFFFVERARGFAHMVVRPDAPFVEAPPPPPPPPGPPLPPALEPAMPRPAFEPEPS